VPSSDISSKMASFRGEEVVDVLDEKLYVAVSKDLKACKSNILWALQNSGGKRVGLLHVHQPAQTISICESSTVPHHLPHQLLILLQLV